MYEPQFINKTFLSQHQNGSTKQVELSMSQFETSSQEAEALLMVIEASVHELNQPLTVVLGLSELLLSQAEPDTPQAEDLSIIVSEMRRMNEIVRGLKILAH